MGSISGQIAELRTLAPEIARERIASAPKWFQDLRAVREILSTLGQARPAPVTSPQKPASEPADPPKDRPARAPKEPAYLGGVLVEPLTGTAAVVHWCAVNDIPAELVGRWVWVAFATKPSEEIRKAMSAAGFRWVKTRAKWAHDCGFPSRKGHGDPRDKYGAVPVKDADRELSAA